MKYKRSEEGAKAEEIIVENLEEKSLIATLKVKPKRIPNLNNVSSMTMNIFRI